MSSRLALPLVSLGLLALTGCAGARTTVVAPTAEMPVSLSRAVHDENGAVVTADRHTVVGTYHVARHAYSLGWSLIPLNAKTDISRSVNEQVARAHGDAVTELTIKVEHCPLNGFFFPLGIVPFWPGCADVDVRGTIVSVTRVPPLQPPSQAQSPCPTPVVVANGPSRPVAPLAGHLRAAIRGDAR